MVSASECYSSTRPIRIHVSVTQTGLQRCWTVNGTVNGCVCQSHLFIDAARFHPTEVHRREWRCRRTIGKDPCVLLTLVVDEKVVNQLEPSVTRGVDKYMYTRRMCMCRCVRGGVACSYHTHVRLLRLPSNRMPRCDPLP